MSGMEAQLTQRAADGMATGSVVLAGATWVADLEPYITVAATLIAIVAGLTATWFHVEKALYMRRKRLQEKNG